MPEDPTTPSRHWIRAFAAAAGLLAAAYLAFHPALENGFYNDDALFLNHAERALNDPANFLNERPLGYFRPVFVAYMALARSAFGLNPEGYFALGIALHGLAAILVWRIARRVLPGLAAYSAGVVYACFFPHAEAVLWIAAHNTVLAVVLALGATLAFMRALDTESIGSSFWSWSVLAGLLMALAAATKEPAVVAVAWILGLAATTHGLRRLLGRQALLTGAIVVVMTTLAMLPNTRLIDSVGQAIGLSAEETRDGDPRPKDEFRVQVGSFDPSRVLGATPWMFSPNRHDRKNLMPWLAGLIFVGSIFVVILRRDLARPTGIGWLLLISGLVPACLNLQQSANGARHYYFATTGAALLMGVLFAFLSGMRREDAGEIARAAAPKRSAIPRVAISLALAIAFCVIHARSVAETSRLDYRQISNAQTSMAQSLKNPLATGDLVVITEPWIDNRTHLSEFLYLFHGIPDERVRLMSIARGKARMTFEAMVRNGQRVLDCASNGPVITWKNVPATRTAAPGVTRGMGDIRAPKVRFAKILPP